MIEPIGYRKRLKGNSDAHLVTFNDGRDYVVKYFQERIGKMLANEWVSYCLARFLDLPVPFAQIVEIPEEFILKVPEITNMKNTKYQFASTYVPNSYNLHDVSDIDRIINDHQIANILVFDYWLYNKDRTRKNILLRKETPYSYQLWVIDHGAVFGSSNWELAELETLPFKILESATHKILAKFVKEERSFFEAIKTIQKIPIHLFEEIVDLIPNEWMVSKEEKVAIVRNLVNRRKEVLPKLIQMFIKEVYQPLHHPTDDSAS